MIDATAKLPTDGYLNIDIRKRELNTYGRITRPSMALGKEIFKAIYKTQQYCDGNTVDWKTGKTIEIYKKRPRNARQELSFTFDENLHLIYEQPFFYDGTEYILEYSFLFSIQEYKDIKDHLKPIVKLFKKHNSYLLK